MLAYYFKRLIVTIALFFLVQAVRLFFTSGYIELLSSQVVTWMAWLLSGEGIVLPVNRSERLGLAFMLFLGFVVLLSWVLRDSDDFDETVVRGRDWAEPPSRQRRHNSTAKRVYS